MKAVVFVDVQNDFITGALKNEKAMKIMPDIVNFAKECVANKYKLYATRDTHTKTLSSINAATLESTPTSGYLSTLEGKKLPVEHCIEGEPGWMIPDELMNVLDGNCTFINKDTFGSFDLAEIIKEDDVKATNNRNLIISSVNLYKKSMLDEIIICGFVSSICILANAVILRAKFPNVRITVMKDLCAGITNEDHNAAMKCLEMQQIDVK